MIEYRDGNLLEQLDLTHILHQANLFHVFGAGLALQIKNRFPEAYAADLLTERGSVNKLGSFSITTATKPAVINLYSQTGIGGNECQTSYDAMSNGLNEIRKYLELHASVKLGIPYGLGCGLANGSWKIVQAIIEDVFKTTELTVVICQLK